MTLAQTEWAIRQRNKAIVAVFLAIIAILVGVFAMPSRHLFPATVLLSCVGVSTWLFMHVWVSYVHKWVIESEIDPYSHW